MTAAHEKMRSLRARSGLSMRAFAAQLGAPLDTRYAYYEEKRFTGPLPLDAARQIATALQPFGVEPRDVLELAGLSDNEAEKAANAVEPAMQVIRLDVALPSAAALTRMFETMLEEEVPQERRDALARRLALRLPAALQRASTAPAVRARLAPSGDDRAPARHRQPRRPG